MPPRNRRFAATSFSVSLPTVESEVADTKRIVKALAKDIAALSKVLNRVETRIAAAETSIATNDVHIVALRKATAYGTNGRSLINMVSALHQKAGLR